MRTDDQEARIRQILQQHGRLEGTIETMARDAELSAAGLTSHATVSVMLALEEEFGIEIPDDAAESIVTVGDAVKYIDKANA